MKTKKNIQQEYSASHLIDALQEGLTLMQSGQVGELRTTTLKLPTPVKAIPAKQIKAIRRRMGASQAVFAQILNVPRATAIAWESGARKPSGAALKLLRIAEKQPEALLA